MERIKTFYYQPPCDRKSTPLHTSSMAEPIEIDADISTGIDALLQAAFSNETRIPKAVLGLIPSPSITVSSPRKPLPALLYPSTIGLQPAESCVTNLAVRWTVDELLKAPIPSRTWLCDLDFRHERLCWGRYFGCVYALLVDC